VAEPTAGDPRARYRERLAHHESLRDAAARRSLRLSNARAGTFVALVAALIVLEELSFPAAWLALGAALALAVAFLAQVVVHRRVRRAERWEGALASVAREGLARLDRHWTALEEALPPAERVPEEPAVGHAYARDLSVTGHASLVRLLGPVTSERGRAILRSWLLEPAAPTVAAARQGAARELAPLTDFRARFVARGRLEGPESLEGLEPFLAWAEARASATSGGLLLLAWALPPVMLAGLVGYFAWGWLPWWIVPALVQIDMLRRHRRRMASTLRDSAAGGPPLRSLVPQIELVAGHEPGAPLLRGLAERLGEGERAAHLRLRRLSALLDTVESRRNAFYAALAPVLLLDVHLCAALDRWRAADGAHVRDWLEALGEWEALAAIATLAHDHPDWAYPTCDTDGPAELRGRALGHPLLPPRACVRNDVTVGPSGTFLLVTGSNMSGKSTLLRAIGANMVLAQAGAPVCAEALAVPPLRVHTSMRIEDSLEAGVSLFMAELLRIKEVVEAAERAHAGGERVLYLLDEILHGTNTAERRIAARGVIRHLVASGAIGAVSTHDLTLADAPELAAAAHSVHFREEVRSGADGRPVLTFDYRLREGIATTRNALELLKAVGLGSLRLEEVLAPDESRRPPHG
jgi:hypothetical protein